MHPFWEASSTARCVFRVRELLMSFNFVWSTSFFSLRTLCCSELTTVSSGLSWTCETIFSTSGAVVFVDAWYCRSASWLGFIILSPPSLTGSAKRSLSLGVVQWWSVIDGIKASAVAHCKGSNRSSICGSECKGCVACLWLWHGKFCQLNHLAYPILHFVTDIFFQIFCAARGCPQMPLTLCRDVNRSSFKNYSSTLNQVW